MIFEQDLDLLFTGTYVVLVAIFLPTFVYIYRKEDVEKPELIAVHLNCSHRSARYYYRFLVRIHPPTTNADLANTFIDMEFRDDKEQVIVPQVRLPARQLSGFYSEVPIQIGRMSPMLETVASVRCAHDGNPYVKFLITLVTVSMVGRRIGEKMRNVYDDNLSFYFVNGRIGAKEANLKIIPVDQDDLATLESKWTSWQMSQLECFGFIVLIIGFSMFISFLTLGRFEALNLMAVLLATFISIVALLLVMAVLIGLYVFLTKSDSAIPQLEEEEERSEKGEKASQYKYLFWTLLLVIQIVSVYYCSIRRSGNIFFFANWLAISLVVSGTLLVGWSVAQNTTIFGGRVKKCDRHPTSSAESVRSFDSVPDSRSESKSESFSEFGSSHFDKLCGINKSGINESGIKAGSDPGPSSSAITQTKSKRNTSSRVSPKNVF